MNRLVSSMIAAASAIIAATAPGGSAPGRCGAGIWATSGMPSRAATASSRRVTTSASVPPSVRSTTCSPGRIPRHWSRTFANPLLPTAASSDPAALGIRQSEGREDRVRLCGLVNVGDREVLVRAVDGRATRAEDHGGDLFPEARRIAEPVLRHQHRFLATDQANRVRHEPDDLIVWIGQIAVLDVDQFNVRRKARVGGLGLGEAAVYL